MIKKIILLFLLVYYFHATVSFCLTDSVSVVSGGLKASPWGSNPKTPEARRQLVVALSECTNSTQRYKMLCQWNRIDMSVFDVDTRESLRKLLESTLQDDEDRHGSALILLSQLDDKRSTEVIRRYLRDKSLEIPLGDERHEWDVLQMNIAMAVIGDQAAERRISENIRLFRARGMFPNWGRRLLTRKSMQLAFLSFIEHPDGPVEVPFDYDGCYARRFNSTADGMDEPCNWIRGVTFPAECLALGLGIEFPDPLDANPEAIRKLIKDARKILLPDTRK